VEVAHLRHAAGAVSVKIYGQVNLLLDGSDQVIGILWGYQPGHVLDADGIAAKLRKLHGKIGKLVDGVDGTYGVADSALDVLLHSLGCRDRALHIADVVHGIEDPEYVHAVLRCLLHESVHDVIGVMPVPDQVLPAQQHLHWSFRHGLLQCSQALPGVLVQKTYARIEGGTAPHLDGEESDLVHLLRYGQHVPCPHPGGQKRLMSIPKNRVGKLYPDHEDPLLFGPSTLKPL